MNISDVAEQTGLSVKTIRYYESISLVSSPARKANGYRDYAAEDIKPLKFLRQARQLDFSIDECRQLLKLYMNPLRKSAEVRLLVETKLQQVDRQIEEMVGMRALLGELVASCPDDDNPDCAIIDTMASDDDVVASMPASKQGNRPKSRAEA